MATCNWIRLLTICRPVLILLTLAIPQLAQAQWQATVGAQSGDLAKQAMAFLPSEMWIHAGDSITWTFDTVEPHTVSFLRAGRYVRLTRSDVRDFLPMDSQLSMAPHV